MFYFAAFDGVVEGRGGREGGDPEWGGLEGGGPEGGDPEGCGLPLPSGPDGNASVMRVTARTS